ncbi:RagB/SusD family nutrient uptake outer membrane protein [Maribellus sp. CM-23]|uniref:RagB/SusD family nutrient uptake outer membrane protein n=1 Tax=Maribellus sp. CM-23 TaxID=2781026 RepID=UPI001F412C9C|nr:RagB/SusD family nutrient uptake outer membrane protein [Maribellus sp. CM-23]MCE4563976.1 RagB/SusD family nutrient uptake outer membrane protein [Maribellus sp. CM-23]
MKNKYKHKIVLLLSAVMLTFTACNDFLEYSETDTLNEELAFSNLQRATSAGLNCYTYLQDNFGSAMRSSGCDESQYAWPASYIHKYYNGSWSSFNTVDDQWGHFYQGIFVCNNFLEKAADKEFEEYLYNEDYERLYTNFKNLKWEVRALRAYFYFELVKRYGNVPLVTDVLNKEEVNRVSQTDAKKVLEWIASESHTCSDYLPDTYDVNEYSKQTGRVTKLFAKALEARVLLYAASPLHNNGTYDLNLLRSSGLASLSIINAMEANGVSLSSIEYSDLWNSEGDKHAKCPEVIANIMKGATNSFEKENFPISVEGGKTGNCPTQNLVDAYDMQSGFTYDPANPYANRDQRLQQTVVVNQSEWAYNETMDIFFGGKDGLPNKGATPTGYYLKKYAMKNTNLNPVGTTQHKMVWILFRLGEVYLNYAEAASQINGVSGTDADLPLSAVDAINKVRTRKGLTIDAISDALSLEDFTTQYRKERMVELAFEDHRFWDVRRWMIGDATVAIKTMKIEKAADGSFIYTKEVDNSTRLWEDKYYFYPINQSELNINPNLKPGKNW